MHNSHALGLVVPSNVRDATKFYVTKAAELADWKDCIVEVEAFIEE